MLDNRDTHSICSKIVKRNAQRRQNRNDYFLCLLRRHICSIVFSSFFQECLHLLFFPLLHANFVVNVSALDSHCWFGCAHVIQTNRTNYFRHSHEFFVYLCFCGYEFSLLEKNRTCKSLSTDFVLMTKCGDWCRTITSKKPTSDEEINLVRFSPD